MTQTAPAWWQTSTGYQIYPRSFCDSNGDGIGDIPGIISKLDHLAELGIGFIWLSPVYGSPMADNGYDISNYRTIAPEFGTLADMDRLIREARARGIGIVMDLVVNHSSSEHHWFEAARASRDAPEHDYYIWRDPGPQNGPPSDRRACFGGSVWTWEPNVGRYYLGFFSPEQPDLNWQNPALRAEIYDMMNWWLDRGIAGFRMDVISLIGKDVDAGIFEEGPYLHEFLQEMHRETLAGRDVVTIGESWSVSTDTALLYCGRDRGELSMVFQFNHVIAFEDDVLGKFKPKPFDLATFKAVQFAWQRALQDDGWNSLFLSNHDLPRQVSKYGDDGRYRVESAKMLATVMHLMKGTPFIYQGEEIGMTNAAFSRIEQYRDVETLGIYADQMEMGVTPEDFIAGANANGRDNARTPMQWTGGDQAGFTSGTPWIEVNPNSAEINVEADRARDDGVFAHYRKLIQLRRDHPVIALGRFEALAEDHPHIVAYARTHEGVRLSVLANFTGEPVMFDVPDGLAGKGTCLISNLAPRDEVSGRITLAPFEAFAIEITS
ncbi:glycoside hydrolase family 13 protein [Flavimaricola marinus]|uniref:Oligo-1,6-glucosidase n=1 Tax=Flavimaricola marinus TaxID=1819565 RepID=A0A238LA35_9RHOB|nr:alpha-glucosidase [Flavimaricola marinus]SMY06284.1 Oligo-1,6-glucosidase [Flavimaricola marinus]